MYFIAYIFMIILIIIQSPMSVPVTHVLMVEYVRMVTTCILVSVKLDIQEQIVKQVNEYKIFIQIFMPQ
jgi:hypothetical protein